MFEKVIYLLKSNLKLLIISGVAAITPLLQGLLATGFLIIVDFIMGISRSIKTGEKITSRKMSQSISKMLLYQLMIITLYVIEFFLLSNMLPVTVVGSIFICLVELKSISESFEIIFGINLYKKIIDFFRRGDNVSKKILDDE